MENEVDFLFTVSFFLSVIAMDSQNIDSKIMTQKFYAQQQDAVQAEIRRLDAIQREKAKLRDQNANKKYVYVSENRLWIISMRLDEDF